MAVISGELAFACDYEYEQDLQPNMDKPRCERLWGRLTLSFPLLAALACVPCYAKPLAAKLTAVSVQVTEPLGQARSGWPLTFGMPVPRGALSKLSAVTILDDQGVPLPVQARSLAQWDDGSTKWVLLDTQVDLKPHQRRTLIVKTGARRRPARSLRVVENTERIDIDTGVLRFAIPTKRYGPFEAVGFDGGSVVQGTKSTLQLSGAALEARAPLRVTILDRGPLRARVELRGEYGNGFDYVTRIEAYAGQTFLRIWHTFVNRNRADVVELSRLSIEIPLSIPKRAAYDLGIEGAPPVTGAVSRARIRAHQIDNPRYRIDRQEREGRLAGWVQVRAPGLHAGVGGRWFWQEYPKAIEVTRKGISYDLWPAEAKRAKVGVGAAKTHELVVWFTNAEPSSPTDPSGLIEPLVAAVDPSWIARTGALPQAVDPQSARMFIEKVREAFRRCRDRNDRERWDDRGTVECPGPEGAIPRVGFYGMWNWGDWGFPGYQDKTKGCDAWGNLEYDTTQVLALAFAATGDTAIHEAMIAAGRHFMDVDRIHFYPRKPTWVGMNHPKNPLHFSFALGGIDLGHTWTEGLVSLYYLTGDERALEAARGIADYLRARAKSGVGRGNARQLGWPQIALLAVADATEEQSYREAALAYAREGMRRHPPNRLRNWKVGILADALAYTHQTAHDDQIEKWLDQYAHAVAAAPAPWDARLLPGTAYVARMRRDEKLRDLVLARAAEIQLGGWGKPFTLNGRIGFRVYSLLGEE
jgi:hypothetical protein